jgi:hypothetical protein
VKFWPEPEPSHIPGIIPTDGKRVISPLSDDRGPVLLYHHCMPAEAERRMIFKPSWTWNRWLSASRKGTHGVQLVAPALPLCTRNPVTRVMFEKRGFTNIEVKWVKVEGRWCNPWFN